jgi:hypothetical protein
MKKNKKEKVKKEERTGGVRPHGGVRDPLPVGPQHRSLQATGCPIGFAIEVLMSTCVKICPCQYILAKMSSVLCSQNYANVSV